MATLNDIRGVDVKDIKGQSRWLQIWDPHRPRGPPPRFSRRRPEPQLVEFSGIRTKRKRLFAGSGEVDGARPRNGQRDGPESGSEEHLFRTAAESDATRSAQVDASTGGVSILTRKPAWSSAVPEKHGQVAGIAYHPKGKYLALHCADSAVLVDLDTGPAVKTFKHPREYKITGVSENAPIAFHPGGEQLAVGWDDYIGVYGGKLWSETAMIRDLAGRVHWLGYAADGASLFSSSHDRTVRGRDVNGWRERVILRGHFGPILDAAVEGAGQRIASISTDKTLKIWDATAGAESRLLVSRQVNKETYLSLGFSDSVNTLRALPSKGIDHRAFLEKIDPSTGKSVSKSELKGLIRSSEFSPNGKHLALINERSTLRLLNLASGQESALTGPSEFVLSAFSGNGETLLTTHKDGSMQVLSLANPLMKRQIATKNPVRAKRLSISHAGDVLAAANTVAGDVTVIGLADGKEWWKISELRSKPFHSAFSPDGNLLAVGGLMGPQEAGAIRVFEARTGKLVTTFQGYMGGVRNVLFSADGKRLFSAGQDRDDPHLNVASGQEMLALRGHDADVMEIAVSPDGNRLVSLGSDGEIRLWDATPIAVEVKAQANGR